VDNSKFINKIYGVIGFIWLLFMLMFPSDFQEVKYLTLIVLLVLSFFEIIVRRKRINQNLFIGIFIWLTYFLFSLAFGFFKGYYIDYIDFSLISIYFITPIAAFLLSNIIDNDEKFVSLNKMLIVITFMIVVLDIVYILNRLAIVSLPFDLNSSIFGSVVVEDQTLEFRITNQSSLMFLWPYLFALNYSHEYTSKKEKYLIRVTIFLGFIVALLSGRRAFQAVIAISILLSMILLKLKKGKIQFVRKSNPIKWLLQILLVIVVIISSYNWLGKVLELDNFMNSVYNTFLSAFDFSSGSGYIRAQQVSMLIEGWVDSPLIGNGLNSYLSNNIASLTTPWSYETVYLALLYQTGIVGITIFFGSVYFIAKKTYNKINFEKTLTSSYFFGILVGFICFVIAGSTNPMVYYIWAWSFAMISYSINREDNKGI